MRRLVGLFSALTATFAFLPTTAASAANDDPIGSIDVLWSEGPLATMSGKIVWNVEGWVADPDDRRDIPDAQAMVELAVDGVAQIGAAGTVPRPDVSAVYPFTVQPVGWSASVYTPDDGSSHELCVRARNAGPGNDVVLGCRELPANASDGGEPEGFVDMVGGEPGLLRFVGWAGDRDVPTGGRPTHVRLVLDGYVFDGWDATSPRPDVHLALPYLGNAGGFDGVLAVPPGRHAWCLSAVNRGPHGLGNTTIGCGTIDVPGTPAEVQGYVDGVHVEFGGYNASSVNVVGWTWDPLAAPQPEVRVHFLVTNFERAPWDLVVSTTASVARPDVPQFIAGAPSDTGFEARAWLPKFGRVAYACAFVVRAGAEQLIGCHGAT